MKRDRYVSTSLDAPTQARLKALALRIALHRIKRSRAVVVRMCILTGLAVFEARAATAPEDPPSPPRRRNPRS